MTPLPAELLDLPAQRGARLVARELLVRVRTASRRLHPPADGEALHDFRVALRRLRSWARAYRAHLGKAVPKRSRRALQDLAAATNAGRDAEVQLSWVRQTSQGWEADRLPGVAWLTGRLEERRDQAYRRALRRAESRFQGLEQTLRTRLRRRTRNDTERFGHVTASLVQAHAGTLRDRLSRIAGAGDESAIHAARIAAKRLRYLLEPLSRYREEADPLIGRLRVLQDLLGELHDLHLLTPELTHPQAPEAGQSGLSGLAEEAARRESVLFDRLKAEWLDGAGDCLSRVDVLSRTLLVPARGPRVRERRYLLTGLPPELQALPPVETHEGWLPGAALAERVRAECGPEGERFDRCVTLGSGGEQVEVVEAATKELFDALWPLTDGKRLTVRRYLLPGDPLSWGVDAFPDRDLVLARVAVPLPRKRVVLPPLIRPLVVREVTDEPEYLSVNLAR